MYNVFVLAPNPWKIFLYLLYETENKYLNQSVKYEFFYLPSRIVACVVLTLDLSHQGYLETLCQALLWLPTY
jgi:hypothetical protein